MTLPDLPTRRKPPSRWWLFGPYLALLLVIVGWSGAWFWIKGRVEAALRSAQERGTIAGAAIGWDRVRVSGFPFRIEVVLDGPHIREPSGWGLRAPTLRAESYAYDLKRWVAYAPRGVVLDRSGPAGAVAVNGEALRASLAVEKPDQVRFALEGLKLAFAPQNPAAPFPLLTAETLDLHTRPAGPPDETEFLIQIAGATIPRSEPLGRIVGGGRVSSAWHGTISNTSSLAGRGWPAAARAWATVRGAIVILGADFDGGPVHLEASGGQLSLGADGRLRGALSLELARLPQTLATLGQAGLIDAAMAQGAAEAAKAGVPGQTKADLTFDSGETRLGPFTLGPAPRVF
jgi:hypothetical protein